MEYLEEMFIKRCIREYQLFNLYEESPNKCSENDLSSAKFCYNVLLDYLYASLIKPGKKNMRNFYGMLKHVDCSDINHFIESMLKIN